MLEDRLRQMLPEYPAPHLARLQSEKAQPAQTTSDQKLQFTLCCTASPEHQHGGGRRSLRAMGEHCKPAPGESRKILSQHRTIISSEDHPPQINAPNAAKKLKFFINSPQKKRLKLKNTSQDNESQIKQKSWSIEVSK
ncbi:MAG: hypothetical protein HRT36_00845 [Alphaproteobacteria bacterium]|nr:hypothetical protein [Alphaproteobacteria bacterium]